MIVPLVYIVVFLLTFFAASFAVARCSCCDDPTDPETLLLLAGFALMWPVMVPLLAATFLLMVIAILAKKLTGGAK